MLGALLTVAAGTAAAVYFKVIKLDIKGEAFGKEFHITNMKKEEESK